MGPYARLLKCLELGRGNWSSVPLSAGQCRARMHAAVNRVHCAGKDKDGRSRGAFCNDPSLFLSFIFLLPLSPVRVGPWASASL